MRRLTIVGMAALCALALSALGASGASAATEATAWTCVSGGSGGLGTKFSDADCTSAVAGGAFGHTAIPVNTPTQLTLKTIAGEESWKLTSIIGGASVTLEANGVSCMECMAENKIDAEGNMSATGSGGTVVFTGVHDVGMPGCEVVGKETGVEKGGVVETKPLKFTTTGTNEVKVEPVTLPILAEFKIVKPGTAACLTVNSYTVKGDVNGTANGAILNVNVPGTTTTLTLGVNKAGLVGKATIEAGPTPSVSGPNPVHHATALT